MQVSTKQSAYTEHVSWSATVTFNGTARRLWYRFNYRPIINPQGVGYN